MEESPVTSGMDNGKDAAQVSVEDFIGQWNKLVSTTNWEKGRIICAWREALLESGAPVTEYSDEAWAQLVGGVTSQHVGRLRRVYQRFGGEFQEYAGLFWSHFQAALDWDDAPMWLEGAIHNDWSVSQMRGKRWETLGTPAVEQRKEVEADTVEDIFDEASAAETTQESSNDDASTSAAPKTTSVKSVAETEDEADVVTDSAGESESGTTSSAPKLTPLNVNVELLPDDLADAFEQFKLAIIAHRREGWRDTTPESVCECLDALKSLALAE